MLVIAHSHFRASRCSKGQKRNTRMPYLTEKKHTPSHHPHHPSLTPPHALFDRKHSPCTHTTQRRTKKQPPTPLRKTRKNRPLSQKMMPKLVSRMTQPKQRQKRNSLVNRTHHKYPKIKVLKLQPWKFRPPRSECMSE